MNFNFELPPNITSEEIIKMLEPFVIYASKVMQETESNKTRDLSISLKLFEKPEVLL